MCDEEKNVQVVVSNHDFRPLAMNYLRKIPGIGLAMALLSGFFFATAGFTVDLMDDVDASFVVTTRSIIQLLFFLPPVIYYKEPLMGILGEKRALWERSIFGMCVLTQYYAYSFIEFADSSAIGFAAPVFVSVFACFMLNEPCGWFQVSTVIGTLAGVFLISRPTFLFPEESFNNTFTTNDRIIGVTLSIITCLATAYCYVAMRELKKTPTSVVVAFFSIYCICVCPMIMNIYSFSTGKVVIIPKTFFDWMMVLVNGLCGVFGQMTLVIALKLEEAGLVAVMRTFDIVVVFIYQAAFLDYSIHWTSIVGSVIISSGCIAVSLKKYFQSRTSRKRETED